MSNLKDKELSFLLSEALLNTGLSPSNEEKGYLSEIVRKGKKDIVDLYIPKNAAKYSSLEFEKGLDRISKYSGVLEEYSNSLTSEQASIFNQIQYQKEKLNELSSTAIEKLSALKIYSGRANRRFTFLGTNPEEWSNEGNNSLRLRVSRGSNGATLPIDSSVQVKIESIGLGTLSNGVLGDPDNLDRLSTNDTLSAVLDQSPYRYCEYTRRGAEGVSVELVVSLARSEIINCIELDVVEYAFQASPSIKKILYSDQGQWKIWAENEEIKDIKTLYLNPVKAKNIRIILESKGSESIRVGENTFDQRSIIGIQSLSVYSIRFKGEGRIISKSREASATITLNEIRTGNGVKLYKEKVSCLLPGGEWGSLNKIENEVDDIRKVEEVKLMLEIERDPALFLLNHSSIDEEVFVSEYETFKSTDANPNILVLNTELLSEEGIFIGEEKVGSIGFDEWPLERLSTQAIEEDVYFKLPSINVSESSRLTVEVNGRPLSYSDRNESNTFTLGTLREKTVIKIRDISPSSTVKAYISPEVLNLTKRGGEYIGVLENVACPIKERLRVEYLSDVKDMQVEVIQPGSKTYRLNLKNITSLSVSKKEEGFLIDSGLTSVTGVSHDPFAGLELGQYYLNRKDGIIYFYEKVEEPLYLTYTYQELKVERNFSIKETSSNIPIGVGIKEEDLKAIKVEEVISSTEPNKASIGFSENLLGFTYSPLLKKAVLSNQGILEGSISLEGWEGEFVEVPYFDGVQEFNNGKFGKSKLVESERSSDVSYFDITNPHLINSEMGVYPENQEIFLKEVEVLVNNGDWTYNKETGIIALKIENAVTQDVTIGYFFQDYEEERNAYSIDYRNGVIYFSKDIQEGSTLKYEVAPYRLSYYPMNPIEKYNRDKEIVKVQESLLNTGRRVFVFYKTRSSNQNIKELTSYYSPVIKSLEVAGV